MAKRSAADDDLFVVATATFFVHVQCFWQDQNPTSIFPCETESGDESEDESEDEFAVDPVTRVEIAPRGLDRAQAANFICDKIDALLEKRCRSMVEDEELDEDEPEANRLRPRTDTREFADHLWSECTGSGTEEVQDSGILRLRRAVLAHSSFYSARKELLRRLEFGPGAPALRARPSVRCDLDEAQALAAELEDLSRDSFPSMMYDVRRGGFVAIVERLDLSLAASPGGDNVVAVVRACGKMADECEASLLGYFPDRPTALRAVAADIELAMKEIGKITDRESARAEMEKCVDGSCYDIDEEVTLLTVDGDTVVLADAVRTDETKLHHAAMFFASHLDYDTGTQTSYHFGEIPKESIMSPARSVKSARKE
jgi:hypothetical protein